MLISLFALALLQGAEVSAPASSLYADCKAQVWIEEKGATSDMMTLLSARQCTSYIQGVVDGLRSRPQTVCLGGAKSQEIARVYVTYLDAHPKMRDGERFSILIAALESSYPCSSK
jgi:hypothetical protein